VDVIAAVAGLVAVAGLSSGLWWRRRARTARTLVAALRGELVAARRAADHDALTGLPNRRAFLHRSAALIGDPTQHPLVVVVVDLDDFKRVNDEWGHAAGDEVLVTIADRLAAWAAHGLAARIGGDEFAGVWTASAADAAGLRRDAQRLAQTLAAPIPVTGRPLTVRASVGMAPIRRPRDLLEALRIADLAMYEVKTSRRGHPTVVDNEIRHPASHTGHLPVRPETARQERRPRSVAHHKPAPRTTRNQEGIEMPAPHLGPDQRNPADVAPTDSYQPADHVWVHRGGSWRAGVVEAASPRAVTVTYRPTNGPGTAVDTLTAPYLAARTDTDPHLDRVDTDTSRLSRLRSPHPQ
jgi:diguanylate cyclase (GGDEF)-like protein